MSYNTINVSTSGSVKTYPGVASFPVSASIGDLSIAQDTNFLYFWDGTSWVQIASATVAAGQYKPEAPYTITAADITNKSVVLAEAPTDKDKTRLTLFEGLPQFYGEDFIVTTNLGGRELSWDGLGLETIIEEGDQITVVYN